MIYELIERLLDEIDYFVIKLMIAQKEGKCLQRLCGIL